MAEYDDATVAAALQGQPLPPLVADPETAETARDDVSTVR
jgi:hypothetical protein